MTQKRSAKDRTAAEWKSVAKATRRRRRILQARLRNVPFIQQLPQTVAEQDVNNVFRFQGDHPLALGRRPLRVSDVRDSDSQ